jgi:hypothetical protein
MDDEDVSAHGNVCQLGATALVNVHVTNAPGLLDAWIDLNFNGTFDDVEDRIFNSVPLNVGNNSLSFNLPVTLPFLALYSRFRISSSGGLSATGPAVDGEVEDYLFFARPPEERLIDFGDAPEDPAPAYPTRAGNLGAAHFIDPAMRLGQLIDADGDGQPNADATGDDQDSALNDEDGVTFNTPLVAGENAQITVNASAIGKLDAFIDFNGDRDWFDAGEQVFGFQDLQPGDNVLSFDVPPDAVLGETFARFRFSTAGVFSGPIGPALDGEVEDYRVIVRGVPGDMNLNGLVDLDDIENFVLGLRNPAAYEAIFGAPPQTNGDLDNDGDQDFDDIDEFVALLFPGASGDFGFTAEEQNAKPRRRQSSQPAANAPSAEELAALWDSDWIWLALGTSGRRWQSQWRKAR